MNDNATKTHAQRVTETKIALEHMVQWVIPRLKRLDLEGYITSVRKARELARLHGLTSSSVIDDKVMGVTGDMLELAEAAHRFQRAIVKLYPDGERVFGPGGTTAKGRL